MPLRRQGSISRSSDLKTLNRFAWAIVCGITTSVIVSMTGDGFLPSQEYLDRLPDPPLFGNPQNIEGRLCRLEFLRSFRIAGIDIRVIFLGH